jgi:hypothetical protein
MAIRAQRPSLMAELNDADLVAKGEADPGRARPHRWTREEAREAARLSRASRSRRRDRKPPSDTDIDEASESVPSQTLELPRSFSVGCKDRALMSAFMASTSMQ